MPEQNKPPDNPEILTESATTIEGKPFVIIRWGEMAGQLSTEQTRQLALHLIEAAEAAHTDAALLRFFTDRVGLEPEKFAQLLADLRVFRNTPPKDGQY